MAKPLLIIGVVIGVFITSIGIITQSGSDNTLMFQGLTIAVICWTFFITLFPLFKSGKKRGKITGKFEGEYEEIEG